MSRGSRARVWNAASGSAKRRTLRCAISLARLPGVWGKQWKALGLLGLT